MKGSWLNLPSSDASCRADIRHPTNEASVLVGDDETVRKMLSDLPSFGGFTNFDATLPTDAFVQYLATETPHPEQIKNERTRSLIRALKAKSDRRDQKRDEKRDKKRPAPDNSAVLAKRPRWTALDKEGKQACIRVALSAACKYARVGDRVYKLREVWQENPRRKQMINAEVRCALVESVSQWTETELGAYLERAGVSGVITKEGMVRAVRNHLAPEIGCGTE